MSLLGELKRKVQKLGETHKLRAERRPAHGLAASYVLDPPPIHAGVKNISDTGVYLVTEKRLRTGELIRLTLQEEGEPESSELQVTVDARVARQGEDGMGLSFVLPAGLDMDLWGVLVRNIVVLTDQAQIAQMFHTLRTILFLCRICGAGAEEPILLLAGQLDSERTENVFKIALAAEHRLAADPEASRMRADPKLVANILKEGAWGPDEVTMQLWTGLLVSSCSVDGPDDSNQVFVNLLIHMTPSQARIFIHGCERALAARAGGPEGGDLPAGSVILNTEEMIALTGQHDLSRDAGDVSYLFNLGMIPKTFGFKSYLDIETFDITPTRLALELYKHCHGGRGKMEQRLVEEADEHVLNFIPPPVPIAPQDQT